MTTTLFSIWMGWDMFDSPVERARAARVERQPGNLAKGGGAREDAGTAQDGENASTIGTGRTGKAPMHLTRRRTRKILAGRQAGCLRSALATRPGKTGGAPVGDFAKQGMNSCRSVGDTPESGNLSGALPVISSRHHAAVPPRSESAHARSVSR
ncbi:hypothetical protein F3J11_30370 [Burkholderia sp. Cy-647]|nr:hypothetical protein [Burkholderia sp. Cy-647]